MKVSGVLRRNSPRPEIVVAAPAVGDHKFVDGPAILFFLAPPLLSEKIVEFTALGLDPFGQPFFIRGARLRCGLFGKLAKVVAQDRDAVGDLAVG